METSIHQKIKIGTCAWSFDEWRGVFYPEHLPSNRWLEFYAQYLHAVEIDSTFYHTPSAQVVGHWLDQTPDDFRFACKAPREITHEAKLRDCGEKMQTFLESISPLRAKLGCVLLQLPPSFVVERDEPALRDFISELPGDFRFAVEFRHSGWHQPRVIRLLEEHNVCWVWNDVTTIDNQIRGAFELFPLTTDFIYVRLLGDLGTQYRPDGSRHHRYGDLLWPRDSSLENWKLKLERHLDETERVYVFVNNHFEGFSPLTCQRLSMQFGDPIVLPNPEPEKSAEAATDDQLDLL